MDVVANPKQIKLHFPLCPGDTLVGTAALECLHTQHPYKYITDVSGTATTEIFENNPWITKLPPEETQEIIMNYPLIHKSNQRPIHFMEACIANLANCLEIKLNCEVTRPYLYISELEKSWVSQVYEIIGKPIKYWVICSGTKNDYTVKGWGFSNYQNVINHFRGAIQFVQVGELEHNHPLLDGVIDLRGKTNTRQLIRLCWHAQGGIGGVSFLHHIFAAFQKPFVTIASGMEPRSWEMYPTGVYTSRHGCLPCCAKEACWKSRTISINDSKSSSLCEMPVLISGGEIVPKCMAMITPEEICAGIENYYKGGMLSY